MYYELNSGKSVVIFGPASVTVKQGTVDALGALLPDSSQMTIPRGRALALTSVGGASLMLNLGEGGRVEGRDHAYPEQWNDHINSLSSRKGVIVVIGDVDSGKTTFCTLVANCALRRGLKVAFINKDPGQADMFLPTTISAALLEGPVIDLSQVNPTVSFFVGKTTPTGVVDRILVGLSKLYREVQDRADLIVVNTSGWVRGERAKELKLLTIEVLGASDVVLLKRNNELDHIAKGLSNRFGKIGALHMIDALRGAKVKSHEERKFLRESRYLRYFTNAKRRVLDLSKLDITCGILGSGVRLDKKDTDVISMLLGANVVHAEEVADSMLVVIGKGSQPKKEAILNAKRIFGKETIKIFQEGEERGIIIGLINGMGLRGLGLIQRIDYASGRVDVLTPYEGGVSAVGFGCLKLDDGLKEVKQYSSVPI